MPAVATQPKPVQQPVAAPKQSRMTLSSVVKGKLQQPVRVVIFGTEGVGKSSFAAGAPSPVFIGSEDGTSQLDVARFPKPESFAEGLEAIRTLTAEQHAFETVVVDTLDWLEPLIWRHICDRDGMANVEAYGYGKGYQAALDEWRMFLAALERLRATKRMHVVLVAHSWIRPFKNPQGDDFDRYEMKLNNKAAGLVKEWSDAVLFANYETFAKKDERTKRVRGVDTGARLIFTERRAAFDAKNRYSLPPELPLAWADFAAAMTAGQVADPEALRAEIERKARELGGELEKKVLETTAKAGNDATRLAAINNRVNALLGEKEQANG